MCRLAGAVSVVREGFTEEALLSFGVKSIVGMIVKHMRTRMKFI